MGKEYKTYSALNNWADVFVDHRYLLLGLIIVVTVLLAFQAPNVSTDASLKSMLVTTSPAYKDYQNFVDIFGDDEFLLVAVKPLRGSVEPQGLKALECLINEMEQADHVVDVLSLSNLRLFQEKRGRFGTYPFLTEENGLPQLPRHARLETVRKALPIMDLLLSSDEKTLGVLVRIDPRWKFSSQATQQIVGHIKDSTGSCFPEGTEYRVIGAAVLREAILRDCIKTAYVFGILCAMVCAGLTLYIFRNAQVLLMTMSILGLCVLWVLGLMALMKIPLNPTTSLSFGFILITSLEIVIHMVVRFGQFRGFHKDKTEAVRETVRFLARPCSIASGTTAVGFGACMATSIPMVFQLGLIMTLGVCSSWLIAMILSPATLLVLESQSWSLGKNLIRKSEDHRKNDILSTAITKMRRSIFKHYRVLTAAGFVFTGVMLAGTPWIRTDPQLLRQLGESSPQVKDIRFVEKNLAEVQTLQLVLASEEGAFKRPAVWAKVKELEALLARLPEVVRTDSLLPFLEYMSLQVGQEGSSSSELFNNPDLIPQLFVMAGLTPEGKKMIAQYVSEDFDKLRIRVRIKNIRDITIPETVEKVQAAANSILEEIAVPTVTGELVVVAAQGEHLIRSQIHSMFLAICIITVLLMIQMGTASFGLISLIPNIPPLAAVFGIMGWLGIPLDGVTIFAATVAIGLAADNTIHFAAQLKREIQLHPELGVEQCVFRAYGFAAKPIASWSLITLLGFLSLIAVPFQAAVHFGILVSAAVMLGIFGDLIFMQSTILTFPVVRRLIAKAIHRDPKV